MNIIVDANVFKGYFLEKEIEIDHELTESPIYLFDNNEYTIIFDDSDQIKHEYENVIPNNKIAEDIIIRCLNSGKIRLSAAKKDNNLESTLRSKGFDLNSRDKWYIRTALSAQNDNNGIYIVTEDIDFFDPSKKNCCSLERDKTIRNKRAPVSKVLIKSKNIKPICVDNHANGSY